MKTWEYELIQEATLETDWGCNAKLLEWPELAEALRANGIALPIGASMRSVQEICRLILTERKIVHPRLHEAEVKDLQRMLLEREVYVSRSDVAECYGDFCRDFAFAAWLPLSHWDNAAHVGPVAYIVAMITK